MAKPSWKALDDVEGHESIAAQGLAPGEFAICLEESMRDDLYLRVTEERYREEAGALVPPGFVPFRVVANSDPGPTGRPAPRMATNEANRIMLFMPHGSFAVMDGTDPEPVEEAPEPETETDPIA